MSSPPLPAGPSSNVNPFHDWTEISARGLLPFAGYVFGHDLLELRPIGALQAQRHGRTRPDVSCSALSRCTFMQRARQDANRLQQIAVRLGDTMAEQERSLIQRTVTAVTHERGSRRWILSALVIAAVTLLMLPVRNTVSVLDVTLVYLLICFGVSLTLGSGPAILAAFLAFLAEAFFAAPSNDFRVERADEALTLVVFLVIATAGARLMEELRTQTIEAERLTELDRLRGGFVAAVSHDLQTPLTAIRAGLGLLETSAGDHLRPEELQLLGNARRNVDRLGLQINDLLALNRLEAGQFPIAVAPIDLRSVIADSVAVAYPLTEQKGQRLEIAVDRPLRVEGDQRYLGHALLNLVANAHTHTPPGTRITIGGRETAEGVLVEVADDGPGIPEHARAHLFDRFYRANSSGSGSGLGLSITKAIVERHGGRVWVESEPGHGTTFFVLLARGTAQE